MFLGRGVIPGTESIIALELDHHYDNHQGPNIMMFNQIFYSINPSR